MQPNPSAISEAQSPLSLPEPFLKEAAAAAFINIAPRTLEMWRAKGIGPKFIRLNGLRAVRYRPADLRSWATANESGGAAA